MTSKTVPLFPFKLPERGNNVTRTVFLEQQPMRLFTSAGFSRRAGEGHPLGNEAAYFPDKALEIAPFLSNGGSPITDRWAMAGNDALNGSVLQRIQIGEDAANAAVEHRNVLNEQEIAGEQRGTRDVEDRQVVVGMPGWPRLQRQYSPAEIKLHFVVDEQRGRHDPHALDECIAEYRAK